MGKVCWKKPKFLRGGFLKAGARKQVKAISVMGGEHNTHLGKKERRG